jgi:hypothetical protein
MDYRLIKKASDILEEASDVDWELWGKGADDSLDLLGTSEYYI